MKKRILIVVGTRPNFVKITQFPKHLAKESNFDYQIIHTGQHYDSKLSEVFFKQFQITPDIFLSLEHKTPASQIGEIIIKLEAVLLQYKPHLVIVVGDVNSTMAASVTANKMNIPVAHIESGLRSFDRSMPEEYNRIVTDDIADLLFVTEQSGIDNLISEGKNRENIFFVGNTMIDTLVAFMDDIDKSQILSRFHIHPQKYILLTMHRPANVDSYEGLKKLVVLLNSLDEKYKIVFPIHPRTVKNLQHFDLYKSVLSNPNVIFSDPLDYFSFQKLIKECFCIITDSGGIQEESTFLQVPCLTLRPNTERPSTVKIGTNTLVPYEPHIIQKYIQSIEKNTYKKGSIPPFWDGHATERIIKIIKEKIT